MNKSDLKIIFVGIPDMALVCLTNIVNAGFNIVGVVPPKRNHETFNFFKKFVLNKGLNFLEFEKTPNEQSYIEKIKELNADVGVVCSYNSLFSKDFLNSTKLGYINSHPSILPNYRGACPYFHIINNGEKQSGITLHFMDESFDTGDIVYQKTFDLMPNETMGTIFNRTTYMISDALIETLDNLLKNGELKRLPQQKDGDFTEAPKVGGNFRIRWNKDVFETERLIRACNPFYSAFTMFRGASAKIFIADAIKQQHDFEFGQIVEANKDKLIIAANGGFLSVKFISLGTWGFFAIEDFYNTFTPKPGEKFI